MPTTFSPPHLEMLQRLLQPKYYQSDPLEMVSALSRISSEGCSFIVGGRVDGDRFVTCDDILSQHVDLPASMFRMFSSMPEEIFRVDLSSTEIRSRLTSSP
jgi:hypothetical protein